MDGMSKVTKNKQQLMTHSFRIKHAFDSNTQGTDETYKVQTYPNHEMCIIRNIFLVQIGPGFCHEVCLKCCMMNSKNPR